MRGTLPLDGRALAIMVRVLFPPLRSPLFLLFTRPPRSVMPTVSFDNLRACLDVTETTPGTYAGANLELDYHRVFGGQILAQTIVVATAAAGDGKQVKSLTQLFPREGNSEFPMNYTVTKHQEGRTFGSTGVVATQVDGTGTEKTVSVATLSTHTPEDGLVRQDAAPDVGKPDDATLVDLGMVPWETR